MSTDLVASPPPPALRTVLSAVRRVMHAADLRSRRLARETGLTAPQLAVLQAIADLGEVTTGRISADVSLSQATVTLVLDRLVERGLVERYRSLADRRVVHSRLTEAGARALAAAGPAVSARLMREFEALPEDRRKAIATALEWLADRLNVADEEWPGPAPATPTGAAAGNDSEAAAVTPDTLATP